MEVEIALKGIFEHYGYKHQVKKAAEEFFELLEALTLNEVGANTLEDVAEEMADCLVMIEQFREHLGISNEELGEIMAKKVVRTIKRMNNEND